MLDFLHELADSLNKRCCCGKCGQVDSAGRAVVASGCAGHCGLAVVVWSNNLLIELPEL